MSSSGNQVSCNEMLMHRTYRFAGRGEFASSNFRPLGVQHDCNRQARDLGGLPYLLDNASMIFVLPMRKIKTSNTHAGLDELYQYLYIIRCRTDGADNMCFDEQRID